jgi:hypothetical protein
LTELDEREVEAKAPGNIVYVPFVGELKKLTTTELDRIVAVKVALEITKAPLLTVVTPV